MHLQVYFYPIINLSNLIVEMKRILYTEETTT